MADSLYGGFMFASILSSGMNLFEIKHANGVKLQEEGQRPTTTINFGSSFKMAIVEMGPCNYYALDQNSSVISNLTFTPDPFVIMPNTPVHDRTTFGVNHVSGNFGAGSVGFTLPSTHMISTTSESSVITLKYDVCGKHGAAYWTVGRSTMGPITIYAFA